MSQSEVSKLHRSFQNLDISPFNHNTPYQNPYPYQDFSKSYQTLLTSSSNLSLYGFHQSSENDVRTHLRMDGTQFYIIRLQNLGDVLSIVWNFESQVFTHRIIHNRINCNNRVPGEMNLCQVSLTSVRTPLETLLHRLNTK